MSNEQALSSMQKKNSTHSYWNGRQSSFVHDPSGIYSMMQNTGGPLYVLGDQGKLGVSQEGQITDVNSQGGSLDVLAVSPTIDIDRFGDSDFCSTHGTRYACYGGAMANAISSEEMVIALGKNGFMGSFGSAGCPPSRVEQAIHRIQAALPEGPYAFNLIHSPSEDALEKRNVDLYLNNGVRTVEASAFLDLTPHVVRYRVAGLALLPNGEIFVKNRVIAKISRKEVASKFLQPAPAAILNQLLEQNLISSQQAELAAHVPIADDITVEADSGGHTDNRPLVGLIPTMIAVRDEFQNKYQYTHQVRIGAAGGIGTSSAALAAFMMGAAYVVTGSVNQACVESGASEYTRGVLAKANMADVTMAPSADMFEMGVKVQVIKKGTMFAMRAIKLYDLYSRYDSIENIPAEERDRLESQVFKRNLDDVWIDTVKFFSERDPEQITRANANPKRKMALVFRWYLGLSSRWSATGEKGREMDYQIWCGPSMGAFNEWTRGTYLEDPVNRHVADVNLQILTGCAYLFRVQNLRLQGINIPIAWQQYRPSAPLLS